MLKNYTILCDSNIPWHQNRYSKHHIMSRLARQNTVLFVNPRVDIAEYFTGNRRKVRELFHRKQRPEGEALVAYTPLAPPFRSRLDLACRIDMILFSWQLKRLLCSTDRSCLILFMGNPWNSFLLDVLAGYACALYHCSDNFPAFFSGTFAAQVKEREETMIRRVDAAVATSRPLYDKCRPLNRNTFLIRHGIDKNAFLGARPLAAPPLLVDIPKPIVAYVGTLAPYIDTELIEYSLNMHPDKNFVFIGPFDPATERSAWDRLSRHANMHLPGSVHWREVPAIMQNVDVCILPFLNNEWVKFSSSLKLGQYIAAGKAVISTPIDVPAEAAEAVTVVDGKEAFAAAIAAACRESGDMTRAKRLSGLVSGWDWDEKVEEYSACMEKIIADKRRESCR